MITPTRKAAGIVQSDILIRVVLEVLTAGATGFEVEYKDGNEEICVMRGPVGFGIASVPSASDEARQLRAQLYGMSKKKRNKLQVGDTEYLLHVEIFDSFGEDAFRVSVTSATRLAR